MWKIRATLDNTQCPWLVRSRTYGKERSECIHPASPTSNCVEDTCPIHIFDLQMIKNREAIRKIKAIAKEIK